MMEWIWMLLELEVQSGVIILLIGLLVILRDLLAVFRILRGSQVILFVAVWQLRHHS